MKNKCRKIAAAALLLLLFGLLLVACGGNAPEITTEHTEVTGSEAIPEEPSKTMYNVIHRENVSPALDWDRQSQSFKGADGKTGTVWWNMSAALKMGCNFINPFPNFRQNGKSISDAQLLGNHYESVLEYCQPGLDYAHSKGVKVVTTLPMCLMEMAKYNTYGEDWKLYCSVNNSGAYVKDSDTAYACINNPLFQEKIRSRSILAAKAGYDGMFYDANPYAFGVGYNCCCQYCKQEWAEYSKAYFGSSVALPTSAPNLTTETGRLFYQWRLDNYIGFVLSVRDECRQYQPNFTVWPNTGMNETHACYYTLKGLESSICEYDSNSITNPGIDSTLYLFRQYEAENPNDPLIMQFNSIGSQADPPYKFHTAFVEAIAGGGALMASTSDNRVSYLGDFVADCNKIKTENEEAFCDSVSIAETAVVYSWQEINAFHLKKPQTPDFSTNAPRRAAAMLAAEGIPFDYLMPERVSSLADLQKYKTLIFTDFNLMDKEFEKLLEEYIQKGGQVIVLGSSFARQYIEVYGVKYKNWEEDVFQKWTGKTYAEADASGSGEYFSVGEGYVYALKSYMRSVSPKQEALDLFDYAGLYDPVRVTEDVTGNVETTLRSNADGSRWWLHCISYAGNGKYDDKPITVEVEIPAGETVTAVNGVSPTLTAEKIGLSWAQEGTKLKITATVGLWTMFTVEKG